MRGGLISSLAGGGAGVLLEAETPVLGAEAGMAEAVLLAVQVRLWSLSELADRLTLGTAGEG